jgi:hypothetical protein
MSDPISDAPLKTPEENDRFSNALNELRQSHSDKVSKDDEERMLGIRDAVQAKDRKKVEDHLQATKEQSNWLYEELMKHPEISSIFRELSIMGF